MGYAAENATPGNQVRVVIRRFTSSEDGDLFISRLEGLPTNLLRPLPPEKRIQASVVDHMVGVIHRDLKVSVFVNDCPIKVRVRAARTIGAR